LDGVLKTIMACGQAVGITITIFNPSLDLDGSIAAQFTRSIIAGLGHVEDGSLVDSP
jgi:arginase